MLPEAKRGAGRSGIETTSSDVKSHLTFPTAFLLGRLQCLINVIREFTIRKDALFVRL